MRSTKVNIDEYDEFLDAIISNSKKPFNLSEIISDILQGYKHQIEKDDDNNNLKLIYESNKLGNI